MAKVLSKSFRIDIASKPEEVRVLAQDEMSRHTKFLISKGVKPTEAVKHAVQAFTDTMNMGRMFERRSWYLVET